MISHHRFATIADMVAFATIWAKENPGTEIEAAIYEEGTAFRPRVILYCGDEQARLAFNAFADEETNIDFYGKRARVLAREQALEIIKLIEAALGMFVVGQEIEAEGKTWKIVGRGVLVDGKRYLHLSSLTEGRKQKNGFVPRQIADWFVEEAR